MAEKTKAGGSIGGLVDTIQTSGIWAEAATSDIRKVLPSWLNLAPFRGQVRAFFHVQIYVYLKLTKNVCTVCRFSYGSYDVSFLPLSISESFLSNAHLNFDATPPGSYGFIPYRVVHTISEKEDSGICKVNEIPSKFNSKRCLNPCT